MCDLTRRSAQKYSWLHRIYVSVCAFESDSVIGKTLLCGLNSAERTCVEANGWLKRNQRQQLNAR